MSDLPRGWTEATLAELTARTRPICYGVLKPGPPVPGGVPLVRIVDMVGDRISPTNCHLISDDLDAEFARSRLKGGEVLLSIQGTIGRTAIVPPNMGGANISRTVAVIEPDESVLARFLYYYFRLLAIVGGFETGGSTRASLNISTIRRMSIPVPPVAEQERIVVALDVYESHLEAAERLIRRAERNLDRLAGAIRNTAFSRRWPSVPLADVGRITTGNTPKADRQLWNGPLPFVTPGDLAHGCMVEETARSLSAEGAKTARLIEPQSVVVTCIGATLGKTGLTRVAVATNQQINSVTPRAELVRADFVLHALSSPVGKRMLVNASSSTTMPILNKGRFSKLQLPVPPLAEQERLVEGVESGLQGLEAVRGGIVRATQRASRLRRSVLLAAFTGRLVQQDPTDKHASERLTGTRGGVLADEPSQEGEHA